jgi:hypothetical protein
MKTGIVMDFSIGLETAESDDRSVTIQPMEGGMRYFL